MSKKSRKKVKKNFKIDIGELALIVPANYTIKVEGLAIIIKRDEKL